MAETTQEVTQRIEWLLTHRVCLVNLTNSPRRSLDKSRRGAKRPSNGRSFGLNVSSHPTMDYVGTNFVPVAGPISGPRGVDGPFAAQGGKVLVKAGGETLTDGKVSRW